MSKMTSYQNMISWKVNQNSIGLCCIKAFDFAGMNKIFANITKVIYSDVNNENIIFSKPFSGVQLFIQNHFKVFN